MLVDEFPSERPLEPEEAKVFKKAVDIVSRNGWDFFGEKNRSREDIQSDLSGDDYKEYHHEYADEFEFLYWISESNDGPILGAEWLIGHVMYGEEKKCECGRILAAARSQVDTSYAKNWYLEKVLFEPSFAKALWGEDLSDGGLTEKEYKVWAKAQDAKEREEDAAMRKEKGYTKMRPPRMSWNELDVDLLPNYQYHLQQMVIVTHRLEYLRDNIEGGKL